MLKIRKPRNVASMNNIVLILTSIIMGAVGQILVKVGANRIGTVNLDLKSFIAIATDIYLILGVLLFGTSFILWIKVLTNNELSYVYPMVSLSYIIIAVASRFLFNEALTINKIAGIGAIILGICFINKQ